MEFKNFDEMLPVRNKREEAVRNHFKHSRTAFSDRRNEVISIRHPDDGAPPSPSERRETGCRCGYEVVTS
ncbi:MAG: hypothetical protein VCB43_12990 [Myxococcota bacterium]